MSQGNRKTQDEESEEDVEERYVADMSYPTTNRNQIAC